MRLTLCGSTRFKAQFEEWNLRLSKQGHVVYSCAGFGHAGDTLTAEEKARLDQVHLWKIDHSEGIVVLNVDGYIGESTAREIEYARKTGKQIWFLYPNHFGRERVCPWQGCGNSIQQAPCALCYE